MYAQLQIGPVIGLFRGLNMVLYFYVGIIGVASHFRDCRNCQELERITSTQRLS
jgi:hypothetical protein